MKVVVHGIVTDLINNEQGDGSQVEMVREDFKGRSLSLPCRQSYIRYSVPTSRTLGFAVITMKRHLDFVKVFGTCHGKHGGRQKSGGKTHGDGSK